MAIQLVNVTFVKAVPLGGNFIGDENVPYRVLDEIGDVTNESVHSMMMTTTNMTSFPFTSLNYSKPVMFLVAIVLSVVIIATLFGNMLVGIALFRFKSLQTVSNFLIGNLALSDFLLATIVLPMSMVKECLGHWVFGRAACNVWLLVDVLCCTASLWNICIIALDRFTATLYPIWYRERRSAHQALIYVAVVWIISTAVCVPPLFGWNDLDLSDNYVPDPDNRTDFHFCVLFQSKSYVLYSASMSFFVPFFVTVFLYVQIFIVLRDRMKKMRGASGGSRGASSVKNGGGGAKQPEQTVPTQAACTHPSGPRAAAVLMNAGGSGLTAELQNSTLNPSSAPTVPEDITVIEMATFNSTTARSGRRSTDLNSLKSLCSDIGGGASDNSGDTTMAASQSQIAIFSAERGGIVQTQLHDVTRQATVNGVESCIGFIRHVTSAIVSRRFATSGTSTTDEDDGTFGNGSGSRANHECLKVTNSAQRYDDDSDVRTALVPPTAAKPDAPPTTTSTKQRRRDRFRRLTISSSIFRQSVSSMNADPRGAGGAAAMKSSAARRFEQREIQATIRMAIIIAFFCGMWLGFFVIYVIQSWCSSSEPCVPPALDAFFFWLGYSNSTINPILYTIFNDDFRRAFRKLITRQTSGGIGHGQSTRDPQLAGSRAGRGGRNASSTPRS